jgi:hypothetical protein
MSISMMGWALCFRVRFNRSLDAWIRFPTWARNFKLFRASFEFCQWGDLQFTLNGEGLNFSRKMMFLRFCCSFKSAKKIGSADRKSAICHICGQSANLTNLVYYVHKFAVL